ncbi:hypothetical protein [Micromonospora sp. NPDC003241]
MAAAVGLARRGWRIRRTWLALGTIGLIGIAGWWWVPPVINFLSRFWQADLSDKDSFSSIISMLVGVVSLLASVIFGRIQIRSGSSQASTNALEAEPQAQRLAFNARVGRMGRRFPRVAEVDALALRVHPAIDLDGSVATWRAQEPLWKSDTLGGPEALDPHLPIFVPRENYEQICRRLAEFRVTGGFLLVVGNSSVGKTRLLYEATRAVVPDFRILAPGLGDGGVINNISQAGYKISPLVVWLDELQRFLEGPYLTSGHVAVTASAVRSLMDSPRPVIFVGTLWPEYARQLRATEFDRVSGLHRPRYPAALDILDSRRLEEFSLEGFTVGEREKASALASADPRLAIALTAGDYNVTEVLAGAREVVRRYERGTTEHRAIVHAAVDARRLGMQRALTVEVLSKAARAYLSGHYPGDEWFHESISELTSSGRPQDRATAPLLAVVSPDRRQVVGYAVTDYLLQRLVQIRAGCDVPDLAWEACLDSIETVRGRVLLAGSAEAAGLSRHAEALYRRLADSGVEHSREGAQMLSRILASQDRIEDLGIRADAGDGYAIQALVEVLIRLDRPEEAIARLRAQAQTRSSLQKLAVFLEIWGHEAEAIEVFRGLAIQGDCYAQRRFLGLLLRSDRLDEALVFARQIENRNWLQGFAELAPIVKLLK